MFAIKDFTIQFYIQFLIIFSVFHDMLQKLPWVLKYLKTYFSVMQSMHCGKSATIFLEKAEELENNVLTNKKLQITRFVRSLLRGLTSALRNLPTLSAVIGDQLQEATLKKDNTLAKQLKKTYDDLTNARPLFFCIGFMQILEYFSQTSLEVQHSTHFPIQVCIVSFYFMSKIVLHQ